MKSGSRGNFPYKLIALKILFVLFLFPLTISAQSESTRTGTIKEEVLPNGLKVIVIEDHNAPVATFQIWYRVGSRNEYIGKTGLSHLLEHMMFKGTRKYGTKSFSKIVQRAGGVDNAFTTKEYTAYYQKLASDRIDLSIELESDRMQNLIMNERETLAERNVVMEERRMRYEDDPQRLVYEEVVAAAFKNHPYRWPVIGWMPDIGGITRDELWDYYRTYYTPNNAVVIVAGNVKAEIIIEKINNAFSHIPRGPEPTNTKISEPSQRGERRIYVKKEAELPYVIAAYKVPNILDKDSYALEVMESVLSGGKSARIYKSLIYEKQLCQSAGAGYEGLYRDPFLFYLYGTAAPGKSIEDVEQALYAEVEKIKQKPPSEREVQKAKNQLEAAFIMGQDSISFQVRVIGMFEMIESWRLKDLYIEGIRKVTPEDVQAVARKYLVEDQRTVGILIPIKVRSEK
ncbi:MAG: insulinase family protein [Nitrospirae bacterium]|nr:insulinase family protein [Nitrospirota bacterium]